MPAATAGWVKRELNIALVPLPVGVCVGNTIHDGTWRILDESATRFRRQETAKTVIATWS
jgi:hypothetical protein